MKNKYLTIFEIDYITNGQYRFKNNNYYKLMAKKYFKKNDIKNEKIIEDTLDLVDSLYNTVKNIDVNQKVKLSEYLEKYYYNYDTEKILYRIGFLNSFNSFFYLKRIIDPVKLTKLVLNKLDNKKHQLIRFNEDIKETEDKKTGNRLYELTFTYNGALFFKPQENGDVLVEVLPGDYNYNHKNKRYNAICSVGRDQHKHLLDVKQFLSAIFKATNYNSDYVNEDKPLILKGDTQIFSITGNSFYIIEKQKWKKTN